MGYYIETPGQNHGKAEKIVMEHDGELLDGPPKNFDDIPPDKGLICVVDNLDFGFEAAGFCFNEHEFRSFTFPLDHRPKQWLLLDIDKAKSLSGFRE